MKWWLALISVFAMTGCTSPQATLEAEAYKVHIRTDKVYRYQHCSWMGEVTGSEGHWYSYLFFANDTLIRGALNDIKNNAHAIGANTVFLLSPHNFTTSVTLVGTAYHCTYPQSEINSDRYLTHSSE